MLDLGSLQVQGQHQCMLSLLLSCTLLGVKALLHCISPTIPRPSQVLHTATVALVISQVLDCKYAGCYAAVVTNICQDAGCIPGSAFGACTAICCLLKQQQVLQQVCRLRGHQTGCN